MDLKITLVKFSYPKGLDLTSSSLSNYSLMLGRNLLSQMTPLKYIFHGLRDNLGREETSLGPRILLSQFPFKVSLLLEPGWYKTSDKIFGTGVNKEHNGRCENGEFTKVNLRKNQDTRNGL